MLQGIYSICVMLFFRPSLLYKDTYYLNNQYHAATVEKLHTVLQANIHLLGQVHKRLQSLNTGASLAPEGACSGSDADSESCTTTPES